MEAFVYQDFNRLEDTHWWFAGRRAVVAAFIQKQLGKEAGMKVLDVGCGTGGMLPMLARWGQVNGIDASEAAIAAAKTRAPADARLWRADIPDGIPGDHAYDWVTAFDVLEHLDDPVAAVRKVRDAMAPGAVFLCTVPAYPFLWSRHDDVTHHKRRYTLATLRAHLLEGGLRIDASTHFNSILLPPIAALRLAQKVLPRRGSGLDLEETPKLVNALLEKVFSAEAKLVSWTPLPVGVSILALARPVTRLV